MKQKWIPKIIEKLEKKVVKNIFQLAFLHSNFKANFTDFSKIDNFEKPKFGTFKKM